MVTDFGPMKQGCCPLLGTDGVNHMSERSEWSFDVIIKLSHRPMWEKSFFQYLLASHTIIQCA